MRTAARPAAKLRSVDRSHALRRLQARVVGLSGVDLLMSAGVHVVRHTDSSHHAVAHEMELLALRMRDCQTASEGRVEVWMSAGSATHTIFPVDSGMEHYPNADCLAETESPTSSSSHSPLEPFVERKRSRGHGCDRDTASNAPGLP